MDNTKHGAAKTGAYPERLYTVRFDIGDSAAVHFLSREAKENRCGIAHLLNTALLRGRSCVSTSFHIIMTQRMIHNTKLLVCRHSAYEEIICVGESALSL